MKAWAVVEAALMCVLLLITAPLWFSAFLFITLRDQVWPNFTQQADCRYLERLGRERTR